MNLLCLIKKFSYKLKQEGKLNSLLKLTIFKISKKRLQIKNLEKKHRFFSIEIRMKKQEKFNANLKIQRGISKKFIKTYSFSFTTFIFIKKFIKNYSIFFLFLSKNN